MSNLVEKTMASSLIYEGKILKLRKDEVLLPDGKNSTREIIEHPGAVAIVPVLDDGRIVMVRQYRYAVGEILLEIPAGKLDQGEDPVRCAHRELQEETGYIASTMQELTSIYTTPGFTDEIIHIYKASSLKKKSQALDEDEFIEIETYSPQKIREMINNKEIIDAKTIIGLKLAGI